MGERIPSIKKKLIRMQLLLVVSVLVPALLASLINDFFLFKRAIERNLESSAKIIGQNILPTLTFDDPGEAQKILSSLSSEPSIIAGCIFKKNGDVFAQYSQSGNEPCRYVLPSGATLDGGYLSYGRMLTADGEDTGVILLKADLRKFAAEYIFYFLFVIGTGAIALLMAFGLAYIIQRSLSAPIVALSTTARSITQSKDFSIRMESPKKSTEKIEEIEYLSSEFNLMLDQIEDQDKNIRREKELAEAANHAKSAFLANMSHELRTPMHGILSFSRFGQQRSANLPNGELKSFFDEIHDSGTRLMSLLNDLLDLSKLEAGKMEYAFEESDLLGVLQSTQDEMQAYAREKGLSIDIRSVEAEVVATFDSNRLRQVFRNLLSNAVKFSHTGTVIAISISKTTDKIRCVFANQGAGIPADELTIIFDKFVQSSKTRTGAGGTGLGLAISSEIIKHHQGRIWAESDPNGDTRFIVELPAVLSADQNIDQAAAP